jgi:hypothetical protein
VLKELAIFRHFYFLTREDALQLPKWEWEALIENYYSLKSEDRIHQLYSVGLGFSGGEGLEKYVSNLESLINTSNQGIAETKKDWRTAKGNDFRNLEVYTTEEDLAEMDNFFNTVGL